MEHFLAYAFPGFAAVLMILDSLRPARAFRKVAWWRTRGLISYGILLLLTTTLPLLWDSWLGRYRLIDATGLTTLTGACVALLALQLGSYWWHRALHRVPFLWRWLHQVHHSAERIDSFGAFYQSPLDVAGFTLAGSLSLVLVVGVSGEAAAIAGTVTAMLATLGHANMRTPRWLGYFVQRPENHSLHHERGVHAHNYGDIALWDQLFGTWRNPKRWEGQAGFFEGSTDRLGDMLLGRDISTDISTEPVDGSKASVLRLRRAG